MQVEDSPFTIGRGMEIQIPAGKVMRTKKIFQQGGIARLSRSSIKFPKLKLYECMKDREENSNEIFRVRG